MVLSLPHPSTSSQGAESIKLSVWHGCSGTPDGIEAVRLASMSYLFGAMQTVESVVGKITLLRVIPTVIYFVIVYDISFGSVCGIDIYIYMFWHFILTLYLTSIPTSYLASILTFSLAFYLVFFLIC